MKLPFKKKENKQEEIAKKEKKSSQDWLPFYDIYDSIMYRKDKHIAAVGRIEPLNIALKADRDKTKMINDLHQAINPQSETVHFYTIPRPVDLDSYLEKLQRKAQQAPTYQKKRLLNEYIRYIADVVRGGSAMERRYYTVITQPPGKEQKSELIYVRNDFISRLQGAGLQVKVAYDQDILDMLFSFLQPGRAAYETPPDGTPNFITVYKGGNSTDEE